MHQTGSYRVPKDKILRGFFPCYCCESTLSFIRITAPLITPFAGSTLIYANNCKRCIHLWGSVGYWAAAGAAGGEEEALHRQRREPGVPCAGAVPGLCRQQGGGCSAL